MGRPFTGKANPKGKRQGKPLSPTEKEWIRQTFLITQNKAETARKCGITPVTVDRVLKKLATETDVSIREATRQSTIAITGKVHHHVDEILESIRPGDLESGKMDKRDAEGKKIGEYTWGPSLMQKVTAAAILTDKLPVLAQYQQAVSEDVASGGLMMPGDVSALMSGIKSKLKSLTVLNVQFADDNPGLSQKVQDAMTMAEIIPDTPPEIVPHDFDNPGVTDATETRSYTSVEVD